MNSYPFNGRKKRAKPRRLEEPIVISIANYLRLQFGGIFWHTRNEGNDAPQYRHRLKAMGVLAGVPDLTLLWSVNGSIRVLFIEVKAQKGRLSDAQEDLIAKLKAIGFPCEVVRSVDDVVKLFHVYHLPLRSQRLVVSVPDNIQSSF